MCSRMAGSTRASLRAAGLTRTPAPARPRVIAPEMSSRLASGGAPAQTRRSREGGRKRPASRASRDALTLSRRESVVCMVRPHHSAAPAHGGEIGGRRSTPSSMAHARRKNQVSRGIPRRNAFAGGPLPGYARAGAGDLSGARHAFAARCDLGRRRPRRPRVVIPV